MSANERRVDRLEKLLEERGGRMRLQDLLSVLRKQEANPALSYAAIHVAIQAENERLESNGARRRFRTARHGEERGWVSLESATEFVPGSPAQHIEAQILEANRRVNDELRERLQKMDWRRFEDAFLSRVLERLGFQNVQITQATRDGGVDARVSYKRGLVEANAIVSAKRWRSKSAVPVDEVRKMRGTRGDEDTAIIITTGRFTEDAKNEARQFQHRAVYLIDGDMLVEICKQHEIGIKKATNLPPMLVLDEEEFSVSDDDTDEFDVDSADMDTAEGEGDPDADAVTDRPDDPLTTSGVRRFRDEMLGDRKRGITAAEIASLLGLEESTVKSYLSIPERRATLGDRIRRSPDLRVKALHIVTQRRAS